ncbi:MAG: hypothetical protein ACD_80C00113G0007 [uncultured bacterium (gcode 4)]|uniref:Uncharacterized protein n=1 Tax=uncultured bacterium (gcode 4) TaxID=1234023 RepID=K1YII5_9BACT|nr:MAG: hypothetical protein ACD_80C00113G0007 [uncultured bacterium (gcode 4)]
MPRDSDLNQDKITNQNEPKWGPPPKSMSPKDIKEKI